MVRHCHHPFYTVSFCKASLFFVCLVLNCGDIVEVDSK